MILKLKPELIMNGLKSCAIRWSIWCYWIACPPYTAHLRKLPEAFGLTACNSWYPLYSTTEENLDCLDPLPDVSYYGVNEMREEDRREFLAWYESHYPICDSKRVLESYSQDDVTVLRQARKRFRLELMQIGKLQIFLKSIIIASAFNKILRKIFLHPVTIGLIPIGGFTCNCNYSKKALIWLLDMEQIDGVKILHDRNGREFKVPELPHFNVNGYCLETRTIYEFSGCQ